MTSTSGWLAVSLAALAALAGLAAAGAIVWRRRQRVARLQAQRRADASEAAAQARLLGRYRIERELGHGAMGKVYLCDDPRSGRSVAVKTMALSREFKGRDLDEARDRFFREAEMAGRLQHPDIVAVHDAGETEDVAFIAMDFASGHDLLPNTRSGHLLPPDRVLRVVARVARALAHAHRQGVVHRDVKPANVIVDAARGSVKVTDFGIARITDASRTRTGLVLGTPAFMSPEQLAGGRLDGRADLYSLGVMAFQLLTGALPHPAESMAKLMHQIAHEPAADLRSLRPDLPVGLADAVARALQKQPDARYPDGDAMAAAFDAIVLPAPAPPTSDTAVHAGPAESALFEATQPLRQGDPRHNDSD